MITTIPANVPLRGPRRPRQRNSQQLVTDAAAIVSLLNQQTTKPQKKALRALGRKAVGAAGGAAGSFLGSKTVGRKVGNAVGRLIFGRGDYVVANSVNSNSLVQGAAMPVINVRNRNMFEIRESEYVGDVVSSGAAFNRVDYPINPGLLGSFPWLGNLANSFDQWVPLGIVYEFRTTSSDYTSATGLGTVTYAVEYDTLNAPYATKIEMEQAEFAVSGKPSCTFFSGVECEPTLRPTAALYTRGGPVPATGDERLYDLGRLSIATNGQPASAAGVVIGEIWAHYHLGFMKKQSPPLAPIVLPYSYAYEVGATAYGAVTDFFTFSAPSGPAIISSTLPAAMEVVTTPTLVEIAGIPANSYWIFTWYGIADHTIATAGASQPWVTSNVVFQAAPYGPASGCYNDTGIGTSSDTLSAMGYFMFRVTDPLLPVTISGFTWGVGASTAHTGWTLSQVPVPPNPS